MSDEAGALRHAAVIEYAGAPIVWVYEALGFVNCVAVEEPDKDYMGDLSGGVLRHINILKLSNVFGSVIEVITTKELNITSNSWNHVAVSVENCESMVAELLDGGATLVGGPIKSASGPYLVAYVRDPSGNLIELVERLSSAED